LRTDDYAKLIVDAASVESKRNIYYLMPFAERLSFVAQQFRALNLVWALAKTGKIRKQTNVAVIGAGLAGVTAACALAVYGCGISVFERAKTTMPRQRETRHRMVHPEINFWPESELLTHTTSLPILEWYFSDCANVIDVIERQRKRIVSNSGGLLQFHWEHTVGSASTVRRPEEDLVSVRSQPASPDLYHVAIVAVGFQEDREYLKIEPVDYWREDNLERDEYSAKFKYFVISGCGDGGMIDALRCAYSFGRGELAIEVAEKICGTSLVKSILDAERAYSDIRPLRYTEIVKRIMTESEFSDINALLEENRKKTPGLVRLVDNVLTAPSNSKAAPIHKVMVYYQLATGVIDFQNTQLKQGATDDTYLIDGTPFRKDETKFIVRHGADPITDGFFSERDLEEFKFKQKYLSKYNFSSLPHGEYEIAKPFPAYDPNSSEFVEDRQPLAEEALRRINRNDTLQISAEEVQSADNKTVRRFTAFYDKPLRFKPPKLFGVPVNYFDSAEVPVAGPADGA
jgi:hypothetical protein